MATLRWHQFFSFGVLLTYLGVVCAQQLICENRKPEGYTVSKSEGDGGFQVIVVGRESTKGRYVPNEVYTVTIKGLHTRYTTQKFTEFILVAESEKQAMMGQTGLITTGIFHIIDDSQSRFSNICPDGVTSLNLSPKSEISVLWTAPSVLVASCITFKATVVERPHIWFMDDGQLTKTLCPEMPSALKHMHGAGDKGGMSLSSLPPQQQELDGDDELYEEPATIPETIHEQCCACDDAKYEVIFEGLWSKETHPKDFPENEWLLHFSDIIGASHASDYYFWEVGKEASEGIRQVAEWGATRHLENELKSKSKYINTIIKARGLWHPNERGKTSAAFRVDKNRHLMSLVSMIGPSPDWIVGISGFELCMKNCTWVSEASFDLFPYDAGTDSGITYMSPNTPQEPRGKIRPLTPTDPDDSRSPFHGVGRMKPFAKVHIRRQRIYPKPCEDNIQASDASHEILIAENTEEVNRPECAVSDWTPWSDCSVACGKGLRMRKRSYLIPMKATMMGCDRQLVEKEMCLGQVPTCDNESDQIEEIDSVCVVSEWSAWSPCSVTCGKGTKQRTRAYKNQLGRKKCNLELVVTQACMGEKPECDEQGSDIINDPDCAITPWSEWTPCSVTCGKGFRERTRVFLREGPVPAKCESLATTEKVTCVGVDGLDCAISMPEAKEICMLPPEQGPCRTLQPRYAFSGEKGMCIPFIYGGCKGNRNRFETVDDCNKVCGFLASSPQSETDGGSDIAENLVQPEPREETAVEVIEEPVIEPEHLGERAPLTVDCVVSKWSPWSSCNADCGDGFMVRSRTILIEPQNGGRPCPRRLKKRRPCRTDPC